jgi:hypothetical protein
VSESSHGLTFLSVLFAGAYSHRSRGGVGQQRPVAPPGAAAGALAKWACAQADLASASSHRAVHRGARHVANGSRRAAVRLPHCRLLGPPLHPGYSGQAGGDSHRPRAGTRVHVQVLEHRREDIYHYVLPGCELVGSNTLTRRAQHGLPLGHGAGRLLRNSGRAVLRRAIGAEGFPRRAGLGLLAAQRVYLLILSRRSNMPCKRLGLPGQV